MFGLLLYANTLVFSQGSFRLPEGDKKDKISFNLVNNLVIIPVEVNGTTLSFLLDTGVKSTIIFSLDKQDSVELKSTKPVNLRGLGEGGVLKGLKSENNVLKIGDAVSEDHTIFVIFESSLNLSSRMGVSINGIVGLDFFKNFIVKTNYRTKKIKFYKPETYSYRKCRRCDIFDLHFYKDKPYIDFVVQLNNAKKQDTVTLLLDSGSSDAMWLFNTKGFLTEAPKNYFEDFLGLGLSGHIYGKRSRLKKVTAGDFELDDVNVAFPNKEATENLELYIERDGSLGGDFLKRFTVTMDYPNKKVMLRRNSNYKDPFNYNMSGLTLEHDGVEIFTKKSNNREVKNFRDEFTNKIDNASFNYFTRTEILLVPRYIVVEIRENSAAEKSGIIKGDEILKINGKPAHEYKLYDLNAMFSSEEGKKIDLEVRRGDRVFKVRFRLEKVL
ncbi:aspartyl protease family protein [Marixanthomonas ophiurae]|uniref:aspartyl protease family protein n=1 Tax=Marixanthomonas ophiurae TaxID=387659 RepID=UPI001314C780|nr:aspartyl protease family protein [Marixanthomonas ophiurae]